MNNRQIIESLGGIVAVGLLCECTPQAVSQWYGTDPRTGKDRKIPKSRLMYLRAVRPEAFQIVESNSAN